MKIVVDASAIFAGFTPEGSNEYITTIDSISEIKSKKFRDTIERTLIFIEIKEPSQEFLDKVIAKSKETGDFYQLSENDLKLLALSMQEGAVLLTNDLSMQNIAHALGIKFIEFNSKNIKDFIIWKYRCTGCKKVYNNFIEICPNCGNQVKKFPVKKNSLISKNQKKK